MCHAQHMTPADRAYSVTAPARPGIPRVPSGIPTWRFPRANLHIVCHSSKQLVNYYEVLEVPEDAGPEQLRTAYRVKAKVLHPDVNPAPNAAKQFLQLKRAYDTLRDALLRNEHDSKLGLASARAQDPRFARFERWRREVLPDLNVALEVWTAEVLRVVQEAESALCTLQAAATAAAAAAIPGGCSSMDAASAAAAAGAVTASIPAAAQGDPIPLSPADNPQQQQQQKQQSQPQEEGPGPSALALYSDMDRVLREAQGNVDRLYSKRYEQVCSMYPAYPDIVWYDVWEAVSEEWLLESRQLAGRWQKAVAAGLQQHATQQEQVQPP